MAQLRLHLTAAQVSDLEGADALLGSLTTATVIADKGHDAEDCVLKPLERAGKTAHSAQSQPKEQREYNQELYKARHLIEKLLCQTQQFRAIATRYDISQVGSR